MEVTLDRGVGVTVTGYHDQSGRLSVDIDHLYVKNTTPSAIGPWANLLLPHTRDPQGDEKGNGGASVEALAAALRRHRL